jgi:hypothetical protein
MTDSNKSISPLRQRMTEDMTTRTLSEVTSPLEQLTLPPA